VVEDHDPFRRQICSVLDDHSDFKVVGSSDDGSRDVRQASSLHPNIILLDIGLPGINGLEVARQVRGIAPLAKIIFLTQESSPEVVEEAFSVGAWGYVLKANAASELFDALKSVAKEQRFLGQGVVTYAAANPPKHK
jgi:DNA-binding NarL/FixJ family response regulator